MINVNWSQLPDDLLIRIVENHLLSVEDVIMFLSVCVSWNRATRGCNNSKLRENSICQMPMLLLTDGNDEVCSYPRSYARRMFDLNAMCLHPCDVGFDFDEDGDEDEVQEVHMDVSDLSLDSYYYSNINDGKRKLLSLSHNRKKCFNLSLPEVYGKACWGSRYGWIVILGLNRRMHLFNPITKAQLPLPSQTTFRFPWHRAGDEIIRHMFFSKVVVLRVPQDDINLSWLLVAIYRDYTLVAISRPGDTSWKHIRRRGSPHDLMDVIYCTKMKALVFIDQDGYLFYYDVHNSEQSGEIIDYLKGPETILDDPTYYREQVEPCMYLVQCSDYLLAVARYKAVRTRESEHFDGGRAYGTENFRVFKLSSSTSSWDELNDMGDVALFVGGSETMCIVASKAGCKRNCIYFCDDESRIYHLNRDKLGGHDRGIFDLGCKTIESTYDNGHNLKSSYCSPFWFSPAI